VIKCSWWQKILALLVGSDYCDEAPVPAPVPEPIVPSIKQFEAKLLSTELGVFVSWEVSGAESISLIFGKEEHRLYRITGRRRFVLSPGAYTFILTVIGGGIATSESVSIIVPEPLPPTESPTLYAPSWASIRMTRWGRSGYWSLGNAYFEDALKVFDDILLWDGQRNPFAARNCAAVFPYKGYSRDYIFSNIVPNAENARILLRKYIQLNAGLVNKDPKRPEDGGVGPRAVGGLWLNTHPDFPDRAPFYLSNFWRDFTNIIEPAAIEAGELNGIAGAAKRLCP